MESYNLSAAIIKKAKSYGMKVAEYLIYADLRAAGWSMHDAWAVAFQGKGFNWAKAELEREMNRLETLGSVQKRIAEIQGKARMEDEAKLSPEELAKETSKEKILTDLVIAKRKMKEGSKEWTETTKLIADYNKIKQDEIDTQNNVIHFFLPQNYPTACSNCLLFKNGQADFQKNKKEET